MPDDGREWGIQDGKRRVNPPRQGSEAWHLQNPNPYREGLGAQTVPVIKTSDKKHEERGRTLVKGQW